MTPVSINNFFNDKNPWTLRLLGHVPFQKNRDIEQVENEYNLDKYAKLLAFDFKTVEEYKAKEFELGGMNPITGEMHISCGEEIFKTSVKVAREKYYELILSTLKKYPSKNYCELGCGYGYNLHLIGSNAYGGEYSINAVNLGKKIGLPVTEFNYYNEKDYDFIMPDTTIFTAHSIEQIPDATIIINNLEKQKSKINYVVHFEPTVIKERTSLLGLMRNKYMELNDYNRNLLTILQERNDIEILELNKDIFGLVPLNTTNLIVWKFKK
ncbi:MAG: hypothetical protein IPP64_10225 [Bacteroidetes bacterium]|nr:hypothetical protein [Bacteroidota bacterium]